MPRKGNHNSKIGEDWGGRTLGIREGTVAYGYLGSMRTRPGRRDDVVAMTVVRGLGG